MAVALNIRPEPILDSIVVKAESDKVICELIPEKEKQNLNVEKWSLDNCASVVQELTGQFLKVEILNYRESHGFEICNKRWLKQFIRNNSNSEFEFNSKVDAISGATISVNSLRHEAFIQTQNLKRIINE